MPNKTKVLKRLNTVLLCRDLTGGGTSALAAAAAAGASTVSVDSNVNFSAGDTIRIGDGSELELAVIDAISGVGPYDFDLEAPLAKAHAAAQPVVEQAAYDLGDISDAGAEVSVTSESTDVLVSTRRLALTRLNGYADLGATFVLPHQTLEAIAFALGEALAAVSGTGASSTDPKHFTTDGNTFSDEQNQSLVIIGVLMDGSLVRAELWGIDADYTALSFQLQRGNLAGVPASYIASGGGVLDTNANPYVANTTYRGSKGKVFDALTEAGVFADLGGGASTTIAAAVGGSNVAGQKLLTLTDGTGVAAGDWLRLGTGDTVEFHRVASIVGADAVLATKLFRDQAAGVAVVEQALVPFANIAPEGITIGFSGAIDRIREATQRLSIGVRPGNARLAMSTAFQDFVLASFARALGIPEADIAGGRLLLHNSIGTAEIDGIYIRGVLKDGTQAWITLWGNEADVSGVTARFGGTGIQSIPFAAVPSSAIQFFQHA